MMTRENHLDTVQPKWFAVYTSYKREKVALKQLQIKGVEAYLPIQKLVRKWGRKTRVVELPLISNYLFVKITKKEYVSVLECGYVNGFVKFSNNLLAIPEEEINTLKRILSENIEVSIAESRFYKGDQVEITSGNLYGLKGKLVKIEGKKSVLVDLQYMGYALQLSVDPAVLRKVNQLQSVID